MCILERFRLGGRLRFSGHSSPFVIDDIVQAHAPVGDIDDGFAPLGERARQCSNRVIYLCVQG